MIVIIGVLLKTITTSIPVRLIWNIVFYKYFNIAQISITDTILLSFLLCVLYETMTLGEIRTRHRPNSGKEN